MAKQGQCIGVAPPDQSRLAQRLDRSVVLVGLMGAGKSCVGRRLAAGLGLEFIDSDAEFEAAAGCSISDYFARYGESAFRDGERKVISRLLEGAPCVSFPSGMAAISAALMAAVAPGRRVVMPSDGY